MPPPRWIRLAKTAKSAIAGHDVMFDAKQLHAYRSLMLMREELSRVPLVPFGRWSNTGRVPIQRPILGVCDDKAPSVMYWSDFHRSWEGNRHNPCRPPDFWCDLPSVIGRPCIWALSTPPAKDIGPLLGMWGTPGNFKPSTLIYRSDDTGYVADTATFEADPYAWTAIPPTPVEIERAAELDASLAKWDKALAEASPAADGCGSNDVIEMMISMCRRRARRSNGESPFHS